ncbi:hypothetical protein IT408_00380 [Candidatus Uhrbacteria bacterium]|nr:hypothetical protein [Candidatus Uhrbacteria bacterium]
MKTKNAPSTAKSVAKSSNHQSMMEKHIWAAVGASAFAIILSAMIAFNNVEAAPAKSTVPTGGNQAATKSDVERVMQRLGKIDRAIEEIRMLVTSKTMLQADDRRMNNSDNSNVPDKPATGVTGGTTEGATR